jgi:hypothetical protein
VECPWAGDQLCGDGLEEFGGAAVGQPGLAAGGIEVTGRSSSSSGASASPYWNVTAAVSP